VRFNIELKAYVGRIGAPGRLAYRKICDPPVNAMIYWWYDLMSNAVFLNTLNTSNASAATHNNMHYMSAAAADLFGLVVGTGTNAVAPGDYALQAKIAHGTGVGQLSYGADTVPTVPTTDGSVRYFEHQRIFTNSSGADITVYEFGAIARTYSIAQYFLMCRDVNPTGVLIQSTKALTLKYKYQIRVS